MYAPEGIRLAILRGDEEVGYRYIEFDVDYVTYRTVMRASDYTDVGMRSVITRREYAVSEPSDAGVWQRHNRAMERTGIDMSGLTILDFTVKPVISDIGNWSDDGFWD